LLVRIPVIRLIKDSSLPRYGDKLYFLNFSIATRENTDCINTYSKIQTGGNIEMSQTQNISTRNALARLSLGLSMLAYGTAKLSRNPQCNKGRMMVALGAMKAAEGTVKFCPLKAMMQQQGMMGQTGVGPEVNKLMKDFAGSGMSGASGAGVGNMMKDLAGQGMSVTT
jgi:hypothetical protein